MTNLEYLEKVKQVNNENGLDRNNEDRCLYQLEYRNTKALEIIAEELMKLNEHVRGIYTDGIVIQPKEDE